MKKQEILICDSDKAYTEALARYLMGSELNVGVHYYTEPEQYIYEEGYDVMFMTDEYIKKLPDLPEDTRKKIYRLNTVMGDTDERYGSFYKFQSMDVLIRIIKENNEAGSMGGNKEGKEFYGIYASYKSELLTPFSIMLGKILAEREETLILDMQENSYMSEFMGLSGKKTLTDALYLMETDENAVLPLEYEGKLMILPPVRTPMEISIVTLREWKLLMERLSKSSFKNGIFVFDRMHQGFMEMMESMDHIYLISNGGVYYERNDEKLMQVFTERGMAEKVERICLPVAMDQFRFDAYPVETLMEGSFGKYVRKRCGKAGYGGV